VLADLGVGHHPVDEQNDEVREEHLGVRQASHELVLSKRVSHEAAYQEVDKNERRKNLGLVKRALERLCRHSHSAETRAARQQLREACLDRDDDDAHNDGDEVCHQALRHRSSACACWLAACETMRAGPWYLVEELNGTGGEVRRILKHGSTERPNKPRLWLIGGNVNVTCRRAMKAHTWSGSKKSNAVVRQRAPSVIMTCAWD
jgi:hypothetical protein